MDNPEDDYKLPKEKVYYALLGFIDPKSFFKQFKKIKWFPKEDGIITIHENKIKVYKIRRIKL